MASMKENSIREYISNIDFNKDDWKLSVMKEDMRKFLGEEPGIDIIYKSDTRINEVLGESEEFKTIDRVEIVFYDTTEKFKKLEFILGDIK